MHKSALPLSILTTPDRQQTLLYFHSLSVWHAGTEDHVHETETVDCVLFFAGLFEELQSLDIFLAELYK